MAVPVLLHTQNSDSVNIAAAVYVNGVFIGNTNPGTGLLQIVDWTYGETANLRLVPVDTSLYTYDSTIIVPSNDLRNYSNGLITPLNPFRITFLPLSDLVPRAGFYVVRRGCSSQYCFLPNWAGAGAVFLWDFGNGQTSSGQWACVSYNNSSTYIVTQTTPLLETSQDTIQVPKHFPAAFFDIAFSQPLLHPKENQAAKVFDCIQGCYACNCDDKAFLRCVQQHDVLIIKPQVEFNNTTCVGSVDLDPMDVKVNWYINDVVVSTQTLTVPSATPADVLPLTLTFNDLGVFKLRLEVINCCGSCEVTRTLVVGDSVKIVKDECQMYHLEDTNTYDAPVSLRITVRDEAYKSLQVFHVEPYTGAERTRILLPSDGIFVLQYEVVDSSATVLFDWRFVVYEFCSLLACYEALTKPGLCLDCNCANCGDPVELQKMVDRARNVNQFVATAAQFWMALEAIYGKTYGILGFNEKFLGMMRTHAATLKQLSKLCGACGIQPARFNAYNPSTCNCLIVKG